MLMDGLVLKMIMMSGIMEIFHLKMHLELRYLVWDDLNPINDNCNSTCEGNVYYHYDSDRLMVSFNNVALVLRRF